MDGRACLIVLPSGLEPNLETVVQAGRATGLEANRLRILMNGRALAAAGRGSEDDLERAARALRDAGLEARVVTDSQAHALPALQVAGGVSSDGDRLSLLVHGRPFGPPAGTPLLFVVGDLGRVKGHAPEQTSARSVRQHLLSAAAPVVDIVWSGGRVRVPMRDMTWLGLPRRAFSTVDNMIAMLGTISEAALGTAVDFGFVGQDLAVNRPGHTLNPLQGTDPELAALFDQYAAAAALGWEKGIYPTAGPSQVAPVGGGVAGQARVQDARSFFSASPPARPTGSISWIRGGGPSRIRLSVLPWLAVPPLVVLTLTGRIESLQAIALVGGAVFAVCGSVSLVFGLRALVRREQVRSVPCSKVRSMPMGAVSLSGTVSAVQNFRAPYSNAECVWYRFEIRQYTSDSGGPDFFRTLGAGTSGNVPFLLEDGTGSVLVQPANAEVDCDPETFPQAAGTVVWEWTVAVGASVFVNGFAQRRSTDEMASTPLARTDRDDVFVGSAPDVPLMIALRSRDQEVEQLGRRFAWPVVAGAAYLIVALLLWLSV
jgi:hypothetical protein